MSILQEIGKDLDSWKSKGLSPTTIHIGPDVMPAIVDDLGNGMEPSELMGMVVVKVSDPGFTLHGPWNYSSSPGVKSK